jgi:tetratricopeptide (TPR) repeat protein
MDKFALVYEFNKESPLITYKASKELEAENYSKALELLSSAVVKYPYHATAHFLLALTFAHNNEFEKAKKFVSTGNDLLRDKKTADYYLNMIEHIKRESEGISVSFDDTINEVLNESFIEPEDFNTESELEQLENTFENSNQSENINFEQNSIVTETLAEIYASQNNYEESLEIYEKLKIIKPELTEKFDIRIAELNQAIEIKKQKKFRN